MGVWKLWQLNCVQCRGAGNIIYGCNLASIINWLGVEEKILGNIQTRQILTDLAEIWSRDS